VIEPVSTDNLCKTGISPVRAGDFRRFRPQDWEIGSLETKSNARKAGISGPIRRRLQTVAKRRTGWLATQCRSRQSPRKFPGIREFYREFCHSGARRHDLGARNRCAAATSRAIPYADYQGKYFGD